MKNKIIMVIMFLLGFIAALSITRHTTYNSPLYGNVQVTFQDGTTEDNVSSVSYYETLDIMVIEYVEYSFNEEDPYNPLYTCEKIVIKNASESKPAFRIVDGEDWRDNFWDK